MSLALSNPIIERKLTAFAQRRRRLVLWRGLCAGVISLLVAMLVIGSMLLGRLLYSSYSTRIDNVTHPNSGQECDHIVA